VGGNGNLTLSRIPPSYIQGLWSQSLLGDLGGSIRLSLNVPAPSKCNQSNYTFYSYIKVLDLNIKRNKIDYGEGSPPTTPNYACSPTGGHRRIRIWGPMGRMRSPYTLPSNPNNFSPRRNSLAKETRHRGTFSWYLRILQQMTRTRNMAGLE